MMKQMMSMDPSQLQQFKPQHMQQPKSKKVKGNIKVDLNIDLYFLKSYPHMSWEIHQKNMIKF